MMEVRNSFLHLYSREQNGDAMVIAKRGARRVHSIVSNQKEWLSMLIVVIAAGQGIPAFYIFRGIFFWSKLYRAL